VQAPPLVKLAASPRMSRVAVIRTIVVLAITRHMSSGDL
jgi:hypothetical protein